MILATVATMDDFAEWRQEKEEKIKEIQDYPTAITNTAWLIKEFETNEEYSYSDLN